MGESPFFMCSFAVCEVNCVGRGRSRNLKESSGCLLRTICIGGKRNHLQRGGGRGGGGGPDRLDMPTSLTTK